jgi:Putative addiction module component
MCRSEVLKDALQLLAEARAKLVDPDAEELWQTEILRRAREIDEESVQLVPWSELRSRLSLQI